VLSAKSYESEPVKHLTKILTVKEQAFLPAGPLAKNWGAEEQKCDGIQLRPAAYTPFRARQ
jgi:hypothetical protein